MQKLFKNILLFILMLALSAVLAELMLQVFYKAPLFISSSFVDNYEYTYTTQINSLGFRDEEFEKEKAKDTRRILFIGDSFVYSPGSADEFVLDKLLENKLNSTGGKYEVFNLGIPHGDTTTYVNTAKQFKDYRPDAVFLSLYVDNDIKRFNVGLILDLELVKLLRKIEFVQKVLGAVVVEEKSKEFYEEQMEQNKINRHLLGRAKVGDNQKYYDSFVNKFTNYNTVKNNILKVRNIYPDVPFVLLINPSKYQVSISYFTELRKLGFVFNEDKVVDNRLQEEIVSWAKQNSIQVVDVLPRMLQDVDQLHFHVIDDHYNDNGNQLVAEELYQAFIQ